MRQLARALILGTTLLLLHAPQARAVPWPLSPTNADHLIYSGYGHWAENTGGAGFHLHEGVDISGADGVDVLAAAAGPIEEKTVAVGAEKYGQAFTISLTGDNSNGWGYVHLRFGTNPTSMMEWSVGDTVAVGDDLGDVDDIAGIFDHLHFERVNDADGWSPAGNTSIPALAGDPLEDLSPNSDTTVPDVEEIHFRDGDDEGMNAATYRTDEIDGKIVIFDNIDIIFKGSDEFGSFGTPLAVHRFGFELTEAAITETTEEFTGQFIAPPNVFTQFRDPNMAQVLYEHDDTYKSNQNLIDGSTNEFYYIVTNKDDDEDLETSDADHYWNTNIKDDPANKWHTEDDASNEAQVNDEAKFSDGVETVSTTATDEDTAVQVSLDEEVILDNFQPYVKQVTVGVPAIYRGEWAWDGSTLTFTKGSDLYIPQGDHAIEIIFSEPVKSPTLSISTFTSNIVLSSTEPANEQLTWTGMLMVRSDDASHDGLQTMTIEAKDLADNDLDGEPESIPTRNAMEMWTDTDDGGDKDEHHKIKIDSQPPSITITVTPQ